MKIRPIELADVPRNMTGGYKGMLPHRAYEAVLEHFMAGKSQACEVREDSVTKKVLAQSLQDAIRKGGYPCECVMRNSDVYLIKTI